jgi:hypothetical protein
LKIDKGPGWNQGGKWLGVSRTSVGTLVPRASHDDNKWWYRGLGWAIQIRPIRTDWKEIFHPSVKNAAHCDNILDHILWN